MALPKVARYVNNVGKSMVYASMDVIKEDLPTISAMVNHESNKEVYKAIYSGIKDYRTTFTRATKYVKSSKIYRAADLAVKSAAEDIVSGKWYNAERSRKLEEAAVNAMGGFGDDEDDWNFDDDSSSTGGSEVSKGDKMIAAATEVSSHKAASMVSSTIVSSTKAQIEATQTATNFLYAQNAKLMGELRSDVVNTGARQIQETSKTNTILENLATNSQKFFENTSKQLQELVAIQKEAVEMQRNLYGEAKANEKKKDDGKVSLDDLLSSEGVLDLKAYGKSIKRNAKSVLSEKTGGMFDSLMQDMGDKSVLELFAANPLGMLTTSLVRGGMSKQLQSSLKKLDKTLSGVMSTMISRMNNMAKDEEGSIFSQIFGRVFGFKVKEKNNIDVSKFTKGPVPFDGITRATINNAIPVYLARIEAALTGEAPRIYNAYTGRWQTTRQLGDEFKNMKKQAINSGTSDVATHLVKYLLNDKRYKAASRDDKEKIAENVNKFLEALYNRGGDYKLKSWNDWYEMGVDSEDMFRMIMGAYKGMSRHKRIGAAQQVLESKNSYTKRLEQLEADGSIYGNIFSDAFSKKQLYGSGKKYNEEAKSGLANTLSLATDDKGKDIWYYLQNMYTELYRIRQSFGSGASTARPKGLYTTGRQYRELATPITDTHKKTNKQKYDESRRNEKIRYNEDIQKFIDEGGKVIDIQDGETMRRVFNNLTADDREKAQRDLANSSNFFQKALYDNQWDLDKVNAEREKHNKSKLKGKFLDVFKESTLDEKLKLAGNYLSKLTSKPNEWATKMVEAADERIYKLLYGEETGVEDENKNKIRGMMNLMAFQFNQTLNNMTSWAEEHIFDPLKKKLGIDSFSDILDKIGITKLFDGIADKVLGEKNSNGVREGGFLSNFGKQFSEAITDKAKNADDWIKNAFGTVFGNIKNKLGITSSPTSPANRDEELEEIDFDITSAGGGVKTSTVSGGGSIIDKYSKSVKDFTASRIKTAAAYRSKYEVMSKARVVGNVKTMDIEEYYKFRRDVLVLLKGIVNSFSDYPLFLNELNTGKNKIAFDPNVLANANMDKLPKLFDMILETMRTALPSNYIPLDEYNAALGRGMYNQDNIINKFVQAKQKALVAIEKFLNSDTTKKMFAENNASLRALLSELKDLKNGTKEQKTLQQRLVDYKAKKAVEGPTTYKRESQGHSKISDIANKSVTRTESMFARTKQTPDQKAELAAGKLAKNLGKAFMLDETTARNLRTLIMELVLNRGVTNPEGMLSSELYNYAMDYGYTDLAMAIDKAMITKYNNAETDLGNLAKSGSIKPSSGGVFNKATEILEKIYNLLLINMGNSIPKDFMSDDTNKLLTSYDRRNTIFLGKRRSRESRTQSGEDSHSDEPPEAHAFGGFFRNSGVSALSKGEIYGRNGLFGMVPKTGVYDVKAGTTIYPTQAKDKSIELAKEQHVIEDYIKSNATGDNANTKIVGGKAYIQVTNSNGEQMYVREGEDGKWYKLDETTMIDKLGNTVKRGANAVIDAYNTNQANLNRTGRIKINGTNATSIAKDIKKNVPGITAGAALGAAAGLLFGNPLLGAAIGGSMSIVDVSETAKTMLFGKQITDAEGNTSREGGLVSKDAQATFKKYFPSMSQHAAVGAALGLLTPFGLVGGALLGSAAGFVEKNQAAHIALFGTPDDENSGIISKKSRDKLKKIAPNLFTGAAAAALLGPFGLVGNIALGAGLGMASTTDEFQNAILGEEVEIAGVKTRVGGLVGVLNMEVITPLKDWGKNFAQDTTEFLKDKVLSPLAEAFTPIITEVAHVGKTTLGLIPKAVKGVADLLSGTPLGATVAKAIQAPKALLGMGAKAAGTVAKGTILAPVTAISALGKGLKNKQVRQGYANYMTAQERLDYRANNERSGFMQGLFGNRFNTKDDKYAAIDATMAQAGNEGIDDALKTAKILLSAKDFKADIKEKRKKIKAVLIEFFETKYYKKMERMVNKDRFNELITTIQQFPTRQGVTEQQKSDVIQLIQSLQEDIKLFKDKSRRTKEAKKEALSKLNAAGFKGLTEKNIGRFYSSLQNEQSARKATEVKVDPEQTHMEDTITTAADSINSTLREIYTNLDTTIKAILGVEEKQLEAEATGDHAEALAEVAKDKENMAKDSNDTKEATAARTEANKKKQKATKAKNNNDTTATTPGVDLSTVEAMRINEEDPTISGKDMKFSLSRILKSKKMIRDMNTEIKRKKFYDQIHSNATTFDEDSNTMVDLKGVKGAFHGRMDERQSTNNERIYYDSDSNSVRVFRKTLHGWKEVAGKAKTDADKQESSDDEKKMNMFAKILSKVKNGISTDDKTEASSEGGFLSKIKSFLGKGLGLLAKVGLGITGAAALGHGYEFAKNTLVPGLKTWWTEHASPWLDEHLGDRLKAVKDSIVDFAGSMPEKIQSVFQWMNKNKDKVMQWYTDGLQAFAGMIQEGVHFIVANLPTIFKGLFSNVLIPAFKGLIGGLGDIFRKKSDGLKYRYPETSDTIASNDKAINLGIAAMKRLGMDTSAMGVSSGSINTSNFKDQASDTSSGSNTTETEIDTTSSKARTISESFRNKLKNANVDSDTAGTVAAATEAAYEGKRVDYDGNLVDYYDNSMMAKTEAGDTLLLDENGNVLDTQDQSGKLNYGAFLAGRFARAALTGSPGIAGATLKYGGKAISIGGKVVSAIGKGLGIVSNTAGTVTKTVGALTTGIGKVSETAGDAMNLLGSADKTATAAAKVADTVADIGANLMVLLSNVLKNDKVSKLITSIASKFGKSDVTGATLAGMLDDMIDKVVTKVETLLKPIITKGSESTAGKVAEIIGNVAFFIKIAAAAKDFVMGWTDADTILGIVTEATDFKLTNIHRLICGLMNAINGYLLGLIPTESLVDCVMDSILPFFKIEDTELQKAREESQQFLDVLNASGTDYDVRSYNAQDKWYTKAKNKVSSWWGSLKSKFGKGTEDVITPMDTKDTTTKSGLGTSSSSAATKLLANSQKLEAEANKLYGMGRVYQNDPRIAGMPFNAKGDTRYQNIGNSGCGPAAAVNAVNYAYGTGNTIVDAANTALKYKEKDGGTRPEFFDNYFKSQGLSSTRLTGSSEIERNIRNGNPTVLMGRDPSGGPATPYGPNPHYVTAKGFDSRGHIIIDDPESPSGTVAYDTRKVLGKTTVAVGASKYGRSKWGRAGSIATAAKTVAAPEPGDIEGTKKVIWAYLIGKGYTEVAAAAIMGNIGQECAFKYDAVQKGASNPGLGICQWTYKTRKAAFQQMVPDWPTNLMGQLDFLWYELSTSYTQCLPQNLNTYTDLYACVKRFHDVFEGSADATMTNRNKYAAQIYEQFTGTAPVALPTGTASGSSSAFADQAAANSDLSTGQNTVMGQLGTMIGKVVKSALSSQYGDTALGAIFGSDFLSSDSTTTAAPSVSTTISDTTATTTTAATSSTTSTTLASSSGNIGLQQAMQMGSNSGLLAGMGSGNRAKYGMGSTLGGLSTVYITGVIDPTNNSPITIDPPKQTKGNNVSTVKDTSSGKIITISYKTKTTDTANKSGYIHPDLATSLGLLKKPSAASNVLANTAAAMTAINSSPTAAKASISTVDKLKIAFSMIAWADIPYNKMIMSGDTAHLTHLNRVSKATNIYPSTADGSKTVKTILKSYYDINMDPVIKFANSIGIYADWTAKQLNDEQPSLYTELKKYCTDIGMSFANTKDSFNSMTVGYICEKVFGLTFDGERVAPPVYAGTDSAGGQLASEISSSGSTTFDTASGVSTEASTSTMGSIFDMFKSAFASAFEYTDKDGNKQNLLSLLGLTTSSSSSSTATSATTATGGAITGTTAGVQGAMANNFPYYNQSDPAWGSVPYGKEGTISSSGCGPTSMAMVAKSYGANVTPEDTMKWSLNNGYRVYGAGTSWDYFKAYGNSIGVQTEQSGASSSFMTNKLKNNIPIISSMSPGHFTKGGHFIVLSGMDEQGNILVNDPSSTERTAQKWSPDIVAGESKQMWAVSRDGKGSIGTLTQSTADQIEGQSLGITLGKSTVANNSVTSGLMGMGSGNYSKYGRGVTPASVDYTQILKDMMSYMAQLVENTGLLAQIIQILTSGSFNSGGVSAEQAAAIANASAKSASTMRDKMNNMLNLSGKNMGNIASGRDANSIIQTMTQLASE